MNAPNGSAPKLAGRRGAKIKELADNAADCASNGVENQFCAVCGEVIPLGSRHGGSLSITISLEVFKATISAPVCVDCGQKAKRAPVSSLDILTRAAQGVLGMGRAK